MRCCLIARLGKSIDEVNQLPFPTVLGLFKHWADEPPLEQSVAAFVGFKKKKKEMTAAEEQMLDANAKVVSIDKLPPAFQNFIHDIRSVKQKGKKSA